MADTDHSRAKKRAYMRAWRTANPGEHVRRISEWNAKNPLRKGYWDHKSRARRRNIAFLLTFDEWAEIWVKSGKFEQRGGGPDNYCMARYGDVGPYAVGNVRICTRRENNAEQAEMLRGKPVNEKQLAALAAGRSQRNLPGRPVSDKQRASMAKALKARWAKT